MYLQSRDKERRRPENASTCSECQGGGELVCCDSCTRSFHVGCLERALEPQNDCDRWFCPACRDFKSNVLAKIGALPTSPDHPSEIVTSSDHASDNDEKRHLPRRSTRKTDETRKETKGIVSEGSWDASAKINVGSAFQVAHMPRFYLEAEESGISYDKSPTHSRGVISTRLRRGLSECQVAYSPVLLRRSWMSLSERAQQDRLKAYCKQVELDWPEEHVHYPFLSDFPFKILHYCKYDTEEALRLLQSPDFDFLAVCDPPTRPYLNKWRPRDQRGDIPCAPFPPCNFPGSQS